jgi:hypothetical protein
VKEKNMMPSDNHLLKIKRYEQDCSTILEQYAQTKGFKIKLDFFPQYLIEKYINKKKPVYMDFNKQMGEIHASITKELAFYEEKKGRKDTSTKRKQTDDEAEIRQSKRLKKEE